MSLCSDILTRGSFFKFLWPFHKIRTLLKTPQPQKSYWAELKTPLVQNKLLHKSHSNCCQGTLLTSGVGLQLSSAVPQSKSFVYKSCSEQNLRFELAGRTAWYPSDRTITLIFFVLILRCAEQCYVPNTQEQSKTGKKSEINRQTFVIWWLNSRRYSLSDIYLAVLIISAIYFFSKIEFLYIFLVAPLKSWLTKKRKNWKCLLESLLFWVKIA
jgi:hypothetical protein